MKGILKKCPVPIAGLILGLAASGNLVQTYGEIYHRIFGAMSAILFLLLFMKIVFYPKETAQSLQNPAVASVFPAFSMSIMLLSTYLKPFTASLAFIIWIAGLVLHIILIMWFTWKFIFGFKIEQVFPSWFIVYVGIVVASVTGPVYKMANIGQAAFWFGFVTYIILLAVVIYRVLIVRKMPEQTLPTLAIFAAPASLLLAGYMNSFQVKNMTMVWLLIALSLIMYTAVIIMLLKLLTLKFYPSYSGFTFPLVISGIAMKLTSAFLTKSGHAIHAFGYLVLFQTAAAVFITIYVLILYIQFIVLKEGNDVSLNVSGK